MKNLWSDAESDKFKDDLALRVYTSRLLGQDSSLVLHGGGNTSVKITETNLVGSKEEILYVKGSGWDLVSIEKDGFSPVRMAHMLDLQIVIPIQMMRGIYQLVISVQLSQF